jgi:hypothetical protein
MVDYQMRKVRELRGRSVASGTPDQIRDAVLSALSSLGGDVAAAPSGAGEPASTVIFWASDADFDTSVWVVPDAAISEAQRAALARTPFCFAGAADCDGAQWGAAVRVMAAIGEGPGRDDLDVWFEDGDPDAMPPRDELEASYGAWSPHFVGRLGGDLPLDWLARRLTAFHAYNFAM